MALLDELKKFFALKGETLPKNEIVTLVSDLSSKPKPLTPTDPAPTVDGIYKPTVDATYANAGGLIRDTGVGGVDEGMAVEFIKNGAVWVKNSYPVSPDINTIKAETRRFLYDGHNNLSTRLLNRNWDDFLIDAYFPDIEWREGYYVTLVKVDREAKTLQLSYVSELDNTSTLIQVISVSETSGVYSIHRRNLSYIVVNWDKLTGSTMVIDSIRRSDGVAFNQSLFLNRVPPKSITNKEIDPSAVVFPKYGKNLFNKELATKGYSIGSNGALFANANYYASDYIPVEEGLTYAKTSAQTSCWYDENKVKIGDYFQDRIQTAIVGAKFIRVSVPVGSINAYQVEQNSSETSFEPYSPIAGYPKAEQAPSGGAFERGVKVSLPSIIPAVVGDNLQLFFKSLVSAFNPLVFDNVAISNLGRSYPRYFQLNPISADIGTSTIAIKVKRNDATTVDERTSSLRIVAPLTSPSSTKNILCVGASATANGIWAGEFRRRLISSDGEGTPMDPYGLGLSNISFVGRKNGTTVSVPLEATGGWSWVDFTSEGRNAFRFYVTGANDVRLGSVYSIGSLLCTIEEINVTSGIGNLRCTYTGSGNPPSSGTLTRSSGGGQTSIVFSSFEKEGFNPFWNNGSLDFTNYANLYCNGHIDVLVTQLGVNDIFAGRTGDILIGYCKTFVRAFKTDFPSGKVILGSLPLPDPRGGMGANYGASESNSYYFKVLQFFEFANSLDKMILEPEFASYVSVAPVTQMFDPENGYPFSEVQVNNRSSVLTELGSNGVHPNESGSKMVSDAYYRALSVMGF